MPSDADGRLPLLHPFAAPFRLDGVNGEAFVLVHGFTGNPGHFRPLAGRLHALGYTTIAPLLPGHATVPDRLETATKDDWLAATVDTVRLVGDHRRVHLVGLSMGGLLSILAAPVTGAATLTTINAPVVFRDRRIHLAPVLHPVLRRTDWPEAPPPPLDEEVAPYWIHATGFPNRAASELVSLSRRARRRAGLVECPALVIQSKADRTTHPRSGPRLARAIGSGARLLWLEHSIHNALFDRERGAVGDAILDLAARR